MSRTDQRSTGQKSTSFEARGFAFMAVTVMIWTGFVLTVRLISLSPVSALDVAFIRFGLPALLLLPFAHVSLRNIRWTDMALVAAGAGLPFFLLAAAGGRETSAAYVAALVPGAAPLAVALLRPLMMKNAAAPASWLALTLIICGIVMFVLDAGAADRSLQGIAMLLGASLLWACYTLGVQRSGMDALQSTLVVCVPSLAILLIAIATGFAESRLMAYRLADLLPFILVQGLGAGILASLTYTAAIQRLGAARSAAIGSLAPALACLSSPLLLGETLNLITISGVALVTVGVLFSTRPQLLANMMSRFSGGSTSEKKI